MDEFKEFVQAFADAKLAPTINYNHIHDNTINNYYLGDEKLETVEEEQDPTARKRGRPKATEKSLAHYACDGVDAEELKAEIMQRLTQTMGTAEDIAKLEHSLISEGKIKTAIPYKLLKEVFGEQIKCADSSLNWHEKKLGIR